MLLLPVDGHLPGSSESAATALLGLKVPKCLNEDYGNVPNEDTYFIARNELLENLDFSYKPRLSFRDVPEKQYVALFSRDVKSMHRL